MHLQSFCALTKSKIFWRAREGRASSLLAPLGELPAALARMVPVPVPPTFSFALSFTAASSTTRTVRTLYVAICAAQAQAQGRSALCTKTSMHVEASTEQIVGSARAQRTGTSACDATRP